VTAGGSSIPEVQALLRVLAAERRRAGEIGTAFGEGATAIATGLRPGGTLVTVELDPRRAEIAQKAFARLSSVRLIEGDWHVLEPFAPFDLLFVDVHEAKTDPAVLDLVETGGLVVIDDLTPGRPGPDPIREFWLRNPRFAAVEILTRPDMGAIVATRIS